MIGNRATQIEKLNKSLKPPKELGGNFIPDGYKKQFEFIFIAEMPSMRGPFNTQNNNFKGDKLLNETMVKYGVGGSYVTDIVKERGLPGRPTEEQIKKWLPFLLKEISIIKPKYIIVLGKTNYFRNFNLMVDSQIDKNITVDWVFHYARRVPRKKFEQRFCEVISKFIKGYSTPEIE